jgi:hypothetical protein
MAKQISNGDIEKAFAEIREQVQRELKTSDQWKLESKILAATDLALVFVGCVSIYLTGMGSLPWLGSAIICCALGLCSWANHATR